jgi:hypothetical protein
MSKLLQNSLLTVALLGSCLAQVKSAAPKKPAPAPNTAQKQAPTPAAQKQAERKQFVLNVVKSAVALPQPDPQDRLRVLNSAASVVAPVQPATAKSLAKEGAQVESEIIANGEQPAVSILSSGQVDCATMADFVERLAPASIPMAEDSLVAAITTCPKQTTDSARVKVETALDSGAIAARPLMALMESSGAKSRWSQAIFVKMFSALPDASSQLAKKEATNYAAMYLNMAPQVDQDVARDAGIKFLDWLAKMPPQGERNLAVNMTTDAMKQVLGAGYDEALANDVVAKGIASTAGQPGEVAHDEEESVSVLQAMDNASKDRTEELSKLPPSLRAREAAAHGYAAGTTGNKKLADRYFDIAFSAVDNVWSKRTSENNAAAVVEEVSEAAAQVNPVSALQRSQRLQDPSAQAISMLAVARVVVGQQDTPVAGR